MLCCEMWEINVANKSNRWCASDFQKADFDVCFSFQANWVWYQQLESNYALNTLGEKVFTLNLRFIAYLDLGIEINLHFKSDRSWQQEHQSLINREHEIHRTYRYGFIHFTHINTTIKGYFVHLTNSAILSHKIITQYLPSIFLIE